MHVLSKKPPIILEIYIYKKKPHKQELVEVHSEFLTIIILNVNDFVK